MCHDGIFVGEPAPSAFPTRPMENNESGPTTEKARDMTDDAHGMGEKRLDFFLKLPSLLEESKPCVVQRSLSARVGTERDKRSRLHSRSARTFRVSQTRKLCREGGEEKGSVKTPPCFSGENVTHFPREKKAEF